MRFEDPEGATPIDDISGLKPQWVKTQEDLNQVEVENISYATRKYLLKPVGLPESWFTVSFFQKIHLDMLGEVWDWAGSFRKVEANLGALPYQVRGDLENLCKDVRFWGNKGIELTLLERAATIHHRLVSIHPFPNGNGRFSRLVADRYLKAYKCPFPRWPTDLDNDGQPRKLYIKSLKDADKGDIEPLVHYMNDHGAEDLALSELLGHSFFRKCFKGKRLEFLVRAHIRRGYDVNDVKNNGHRPLNIAIKEGHKEIVLILLKAGADFRTRDKSGPSAFELALTRGMYDVAYDMHKRGHPYQPRHPNHTLKIPYQNLYKFDMRYF